MAAQILEKSQAERQRARERAQRGFEADVEAAIAALMAGGSIADYQSTLNDLIKRQMTAEAMLGAGRELSANEIALISERARIQQAYAARWADEIGVALMQGEQLSEAALINRGYAYGGAAYAAYFQAQEMESDADTVVDYIAHDDAVTCSPCLDAAERGPYLPNDGPMPGAVCFGRSRCRCRREYRQDAAKAAELRGSN